MSTAFSRGFTVSQIDLQYLLLDGYSNPGDTAYLSIDCVSTTVFPHTVPVPRTHPP